MNVMSLLPNFLTQVKSPKLNICLPSHWDGCTIERVEERVRISNA